MVIDSMVISVKRLTGKSADNTAATIHTTGPTDVLPWPPTAATRNVPTRMHPSPSTK